MCVCENEDYKSLLQENVRLKEQNDDLQAQVLGMQVREGRNLLATGSTLADELQTLPRDEVRFQRSDVPSAPSFV